MNNKLPEGWGIDKLEKLVSFTRGSEPGSSSYTDDNSYTRFLRVSDISGTGKEEIYTTAENLKIVNKGDLLITLDGTPGIISDEFEGAISSGIRKIDIISKNLLQDYLKFYLRSENVQRIIYKYATGATILHASKSIQYINVVLPPIDIQKDIINIMKRSESALNKRKQAIALLDDLVKSQFIEMFGDPVTNSKGWEKVSLNELGELSRGKSKHRPRNAPELLGGPYPLVQTGDIANAGIYLKEYTQTYSEFGLKQSKMWNKGTLCITIAANIAKTSILTFDACFPDSVVAFIPNEKTNNMFIQFWMSFLQKILEDSAPESAQKNINLKILSEQKVIVPPIELQNQFADFVEQVDKLKFEMENSLKELEDNFNSLMQKAFNGELFSE